MKKLTVITGAAGMIGSGIVRHLNDEGNGELILVDDLKQSDKWKNLVGKKFADLIPRAQLLDWLRGKEDTIDAILHLGACSDTMEIDADYLLENNYRYTIRLAEWAVKSGVRFIYASSAATYGDGSLGFSDDEGSLERLKPINMYAFSKHMVDLWLKREGYLDRVVGLKYFNVFGPNEYHKGRMASMVLKMCTKAQIEGKIQLYKSNDSQFAHGGQMRDFIYLKDAVRISCALLEPKYRNVVGIYNVGQGTATTWNFLADSLFKSLQRGTHIEYIDMPPELDKQYQNYTCADMRKLHNIFSSDPRHSRTTPIEESVLEYVQGYLLRRERW